MTDVVGIVLGGSMKALEEYQTAVDLCTAAGKPFVNFIINDMIESFSGQIDNAVTLHPNKLALWLPNRKRADFPAPARIWAHRPAYHGGPHDAVTNWTRDWGGSSGLFCIKIAREEQLRHIILAGVPMTVEDDHFKRRVRWNAAHGFRRAWTHYRSDFAPFVRSLSGWTAEQFGLPTREWLDIDIPDPKPIHAPGVSSSLGRLA